MVRCKSPRQGRRVAMRARLRSVLYVTRLVQGQAAPGRERRPPWYAVAHGRSGLTGAMEQTAIDTTYLIRCIGTLERALDGLGGHDGGDVVYGLYRETCVKEFELVLEQSGKLLRKRLRPWFASNRQADRLTFKDLFRHAAKYGLLPADACERWLEYRDNRNDTAHDGGEGFAEATLKLLPGFIADAKALAAVIDGPAMRDAPPANGQAAGALHLPDRHRATLEALLHEHLPDVEVWAYGSRVNGRSHDGSDLNLVLRGPGLAKIDVVRLAAFQSALQESTIPFLVELHDWAHLPNPFHHEIEKNYVAIFGSKHMVVSSGTPRGWRSLPFSDAVLINPPTLLDRGRTYPYVDMASVSVRLRSTYASEQRKFRGSGSRFRDGDTLMARITPCLENGKIGRYRADDRGAAHGSTEFLVIRGRPKVTRADFAYYLTRCQRVRDYAISQMTGTSGRQRVPTESLTRLIVLVPPIREQEAIARVLGTLDDKIELNRRMNDTLEAMVRALFKSWFIDFDPVRAKQEGRDIGLPQHIVHRFPNQMVESEIAETPQGWQGFRLNDLADRHKKTIAPFSCPETEFEHYSIPAYDSGQIPRIDHGAAIRSNKLVIPPNAVLLSKLNPDIARVWIPELPGQRPQVCSSEFLVFTPRESGNRSILYSLFTDSRFRSLMQSAVTGTSKSHQRVAPTAIYQSSVLSGTPTLFRLFDEAVDPWINRIIVNRAESRTLSSIRDHLLPELISGKHTLTVSKPVADLG